MKRLALLILFAAATLNATQVQAQSIEYDGLGTVEIFGTDQADRCEVDEYFDDVRIRLYNANNNQVDYLRVPGLDVAVIIFYGMAGDDDFEVKDQEEIVDDGIVFNCFLIGGTGLDCLIGGPYADYLDGGYDKSQDILMGCDGADEFVRWYKIVEINGKTYTTSTTSTKTYDWKYANGIAPETDKVVQKEEILDFNRYQDTITEREVP